MLGLPFCGSFLGNRWHVGPALPWGSEWSGGGPGGRGWGARNGSGSCPKAFLRMRATHKPQCEEGRPQNRLWGLRGYDQLCPWSQGAWAGSRGDSSTIGQDPGTGTSAWALAGTWMLTLSGGRKGQ